MLSSYTTPPSGRQRLPGRQSRVNPAQNTKVEISDADNEEICLKKVFAKKKRKEKSTRKELISLLCRL